MPFLENFREFLDTDEFASDGLVRTTQGISYKIRGIFSSEYTSAPGAISGLSGINASNPSFECPSSHTSKLKYDDQIRIEDKNYRVRSINPDGTGWTTLILEEEL